MIGLVKPIHTHLSASVMRRFMEHVSSPTPSVGCCLWLGTTYKAGYGRFCLTGLDALAHRVALTHKLGRDICGMAIHSCDTPSCVNPDHLREGSRADNAQDMVDRGRQAHQYGVLNGEAKLTEADVVAIRASAGAISQSELGKRYNVSQGLVAMIIARKAWRHIPAAENDRSSVRVPHVGALNGKAKLTEADVVAIRALTGVPQREIARRYGVGSTAIVKIIGRKTWRHI